MNSIDRVREYLTPYGVADRIRELDENTATVELAAAALGVEPRRIAKTLSFMAGEQPVFIVAAGDARVDNRKYKAQFGCKARMMTAEELATLTGLRFGGVCPFALPECVHVYLDQSLLAWDIVYPACGTDNSAIPLTVSELERCSRAKGIIDIARERADS